MHAEAIARVEAITAAESSTNTDAHLSAEFLNAAPPRPWAHPQPKAVDELYAESFRGIDRLRRVHEQSGAIVSDTWTGTAR